MDKRPSIAELQSLGWSDDSNMRTLLEIAAEGLACCPEVDNKAACEATHALCDTLAKVRE